MPKFVVSLQPLRFTIYSLLLLEKFLTDKTYLFIITYLKFLLRFILLTVKIYLANYMPQLYLAFEY